MLGSAATFGYVIRPSLALGLLNVDGIDGLGFSFFMSIGSAIRAEAPPHSVEAFARAQGRPIIMPRRIPPSAYMKVEDRS